MGEGGKLCKGRKAWMELIYTKGRRRVLERKEAGTVQEGRG
jgi:hypothetical protein